MMRRKRLWITLLVSMCLIYGCDGKGAQTVPEITAVESAAAEQETTAASIAPSETEAASEVNRYEEIIDRSRDAGKLTMYFVDMEVKPDSEDKSGDSTILISPDGKVMLLDAGHPDAAPGVIGLLKDLGIEKIDYFVASHPHIDHIGGLPAVADEFEIGRAYRSYVEYTTKTYDNYVEALDRHQIESVYLKTGDVIDFGDKVQIEILGPSDEIKYPEDFPKNSTQFLNNNSLVMKFTYGESTALFAGDLYVAQEKEYLNQYGEKLQADVIKANHHGKDTSNLKKWMKTLNPDIVVAMHDEMGSMSVYNDYVKNGAEYHLTCYDGIVKVTMDDRKAYEVTDQKDSWLN